MHVTDDIAKSSAAELFVVDSPPLTDASGVTLPHRSKSPERRSTEDKPPT